MLTPWVGFGVTKTSNSLGLGLGANTPVASIGSGLTITGSTLTATVTGLPDGVTVSGYQWTDDGANITGATSSTYAAAIGTDSVADASVLRCVVSLSEGDPITSNARTIAYAAGSVTESGLADWPIGTTLNIDLSTDFTTTNLTGSFVIAGMPAGAVDDGDGTISGAATGPIAADNAFTTTYTDQYGRTIVGNYSVDVAAEISDVWVENGESPELVTSFTLASDKSTAGEYFRVNGDDSDFATAFATEEIAPMWANGKWVAHNYLPDPSDITQWTAAGCTLSTDTITSTTTSAPRAEKSINFGGNQATIHAVVEAGTANVAWLYHHSGSLSGVAYFDLSDLSTQAVAGSTRGPADLTIEDLGSGKYHIQATWASTQSSAAAVGVGLSDAKGSLAATSGETLKVYDAGGNRSDYGGMADSPFPVSGSYTGFVDGGASAKYYGVPERDNLATMHNSDGDLVWCAHQWFEATSNPEKDNWAKIGLTFSDSDTVGSLTGKKWIASSSNEQQRINYVDPWLNLVDGTNDVVRMYAIAKPGEWNFLSFGRLQFGACFDLSDGSISNQTALEGSGAVALSGDLAGYYYVYIDFIPTDTHDPSYWISDVAIGTTGSSAQGNGSDGLHVLAVGSHKVGPIGMAENPDAESWQTGLSTLHVPAGPNTVYKPRRNNYIYNGTSWVKSGLVKDPAATNLHDQSDGTGVTGVGCTLVDDVETNNGVSFHRMDITAGSANRGAYDSISSLATNQYVYSSLLKADGAAYMGLCLSNGANQAFSVLWDTSDMSFATSNIAGVTNTDYGLVDLGGGVYFAWITADYPAASVTYYPQPICSGSASPTWSNGRPTSSMLAGEDVLFGYQQVEVGSFPTSHIPTAGAAVTRNADPDLEILPANLPVSAGMPSDVSMWAKGSMNRADENANPELYIWNWYASTNDRLQAALYSTSGTGGLWTVQRESGNALSQLTGGGDDFAAGVNIPYNIAARYTATEHNHAIAGTADTLKVPTGVPDLTGRTLDLNTTFSGGIDTFVLWAADIGDTGIEGATS